MNALVPILFWSSLAALFVTKAADVISTVRHVGVRGESNPLARALFERFVMTSGLVLVCGLFSVFAVGQYLLVWWLCGPAAQLLNALFGFLLSRAQGMRHDSMRPDGAPGSPLSPCGAFRRGAHG